MTACLRRYLTTAALFGTVALFCFARLASGSDPVRQISPDEFEAILAEQQGNIVILNLWATWCAPCLVEIPDLLKVESELKHRNVSLIGVSVDEPAFNTNNITRMRDKRFPDFLTYARDNRDTDYLISVVDPAWNEVVPTTYIIDRAGEIHTRIQGKKSLKEFKAAVLAAIE
ncbi:MAG: TlpA disulfide reductase family protein [Rhodospirillaceae bacterium]|nr:TlpA disulfide reductase family protein [Rhodospirillaceae bacterium]